MCSGEKEMESDCSMGENGLKLDSGDGRITS